MYKYFLGAVAFAACAVFSSCSKEEDGDNIDLSIGDLVGTWETDYFEKPPFYGPFKVDIKGNYTMKISYDIDENNDGPLTVIENCDFTLDGNKISYESDFGYSATITVKEFTGPKMKFTVSGGELEITLDAKKIK